MAVTLREHILWVNGSLIRRWWIWHHYLSIALTAVLLIWPVTPAPWATNDSNNDNADHDHYNDYRTGSYWLFRRQFWAFSIYLGTMFFARLSLTL